MVEKVEMKDLFIIKNGYTPSKNHPEYWEGGTIPWFRMEDIRQNGRILNDSIQHITPLGVKKSGLFPANSIIVATTATIGEHALVIVDSLANQQFTFLTKCKSFDSKLDMKYMHYYMFIVDEWCKKNTNVSGFASVDMEKFKRLQIPIPSLEEQKRIVGFLDTFTDSIENLKQQIAQRRKQYEHYRDQLLDLGGKEGVEMKTLGEIGEICMCKRIMKNQTAESGEVPFFKIGTFGSLPDAFISKTLFEEYKSKYSYPKKGDILISAAGTIGKSVIFDGEDAYFQDSNIVWIDNDETKVSNAFLRYFYQVAKWKTDGGTIKRLYNYNLKHTSISIPPLSEQQRIVSILDTFEASISNLEAQLAQRQKQYEYYRNQLLTFE